MDYNIVISGTIGSWWCSVSADYVRYVLSQNKGKEVHVGFCSLGGYVKDGLEINQAFKDHGNVHAHAFGMNASISTIAMLGCKSIDIVKGSFFLIHNVSTWIDRYEQSNKEQLDKYIAELKEQRDSLATFDDVLAGMYADKTGKTVDECLAQMKKGNWLTAQQAVDFGLVDSIREDKKAESAAIEQHTNFVNNFNSTFKDAGIPPLPVADDSNDIADRDGNPTPSFLEKTCQLLKNLLPNQHASNISNKMNKLFAFVMAALAVTDGFKEDGDGNITLNQEQMKTLDDKLKEFEDKLKEATTNAATSEATIKSLRDQLAQAQKDAQEKDEQIATLKNSAGDETKEVPAGESAFSSSDMFNAVNFE